MTIINNKRPKLIFLLILICLSIVNLLLNLDAIIQSNNAAIIESGIDFNSNRSFFLFVSIGIIAMNMLLIVAFDSFLLFILTKLIIKKTLRVKEFVLPVILSNILGLVVGIIFNHFFIERLFKNYFLYALISPVTPAKALAIFFLCKEFCDWDGIKKPIFLCVAYSLFGYIASSLLYVFT